MSGKQHSCIKTHAGYIDSVNFVVPLSGQIAVLPLQSLPSLERCEIRGKCWPCNGATLKPAGYSTKSLSLHRFGLFYVRSPRTQDRGFTMFGSLVGLVSDVAKIATAPVSIALDVTRAATKPVADAAEEVAKDVKESLKQDDTKLW